MSAFVVVKISPPRAEDEVPRYPVAEPLASRRSTLVAFLAYLAFVVYGSLVPFEYRDHSLHQALQQFRDIAYLNLGVASRADWIANIVLYVPLAFLGCVWMLGMRRVSAFRWLGVILVFALCVGVAVAVEFTQIFFAPRTVSLNDLMAETLGTLGGIGLWIFGRRQIADLWDAFTRGGRQSLVAAAAAYGIIYVALSLFPYDFVLSGQELAWKLASGNQGWLIAAECGGWLRCSARLAGDAIAIAPLGVLLGLLAPTASYRRVFWAGALLGLLAGIPAAASRLGGQSRSLRAHARRGVGGWSRGQSAAASLRTEAGGRAHQACRAHCRPAIPGPARRLERLVLWPLAASGRGPCSVWRTFASCRSTTTTSPQSPRPWLVRWRMRRCMPRSVL